MEYAAACIALPSTAAFRESEAPDSECSGATNFLQSDMSSMLSHPDLCVAPWSIRALLSTCWKVLRMDLAVHHGHLPV
jgi:hypothetical protein